MEENISINSRDDDTRVNIIEMKQPTHLKKKLMILIEITRGIHFFV